MHVDGIGPPKLEEREGYGLPDLTNRPHVHGEGWRPRLLWAMEPPTVLMVDNSGIAACSPLGLALHPTLSTYWRSPRPESGSQPV